MTDDRRADIDKVREIAEELGTPGQKVTPDERDSDDREALHDEIRRRRARGDDKPITDQDVE